MAYAAAPLDAVRCCWPMVYVVAAPARLPCGRPMLHAVATPLPARPVAG
jgi:hypothetical protein